MTTDPLHAVDTLCMSNGSAVLLKLNNPDSSTSRLISSANSVLRRCGEMQSISGHHWYLLNTKLQAAPERTHGTGSNLLHVDYLSHTTPPRYIALLGLQPDPLGGGATHIAPFSLALNGVSEDILALLKMPVFTYWADPTGASFGESLGWFPILDPSIDVGFVRFTAKMLTHPGGVQVFLHSSVKSKSYLFLEALQTFYFQLLSSQWQHRLERGELLLFDQRYWAHGRQALGSGQEAISTDSRRVLLQAYLQPLRSNE